MPDFTDVYAIPGEHNIIDYIVPATGLTAVFQQTEAEVLAREPRAVRMTWEEFRAKQIERQNTPIAWEPTTRAKFWEMLEVLPPIDWRGDSFLVGEPFDHSYETGQPRYQAYAQIGTGDFARYVGSSRPITRAELRDERANGRIK